MKSLALVAMAMALSLNAFADQRNYEYAIVLSRTSKSSAQSNIDSILAAQKNQEAIKKAITNSLRGTLVPMVKLVNPSNLAHQDNIQQIAVQSLKAFATALQSELKGVPLSEPNRFQIQIVPVISKELAARVQGGDVPYRPYSTDKYAVYENLPSVENAYKTSHDFFVTDAYQGQLKLVESLSASKNPFFMSMSIDLDLQVNAAQSKLTTQVVVGMPTNKSVPFNQANEQIQFTTMQFPALKTLNGIVSQYPCAFVTISQNLAASPMQMNIQFGPLGTYSADGVWTRPNGIDYREFTPKLAGKAKVKGVQLIPVDFNIYNLNVNVETQTISDLDLRLWVKLISKIPGVGMINKETIDQQFETEINKTIKSEILKQKEALKAKGLDAASSNTSLPPAAVEAILTNAFEVVKGATP